MPSRLGSIHVATTKRFYKDRLYQTHLLRRSYREGPQAKHETLGNISHLPADLIDLIKRSLAGEKFVSAAEAFTIERSLPHGHVEAVLGTMAKLGIDRVIFSKRCRQRDLVIAMMVERIIHQCSKLATTRLWHHTTLAERWHRVVHDPRDARALPVVAVHVDQRCQVTLLTEPGQPVEAGVVHR